MIGSHRQQFNREWTPEAYGRFLATLERAFGEPTPFRHSETPCFLPASLVDRMARYGREIAEQVAADAECLEHARESIPPKYLVPGEPKVPLFVQADFGLDQDLEPKLVEIQGFPSLYAYQPVLAAAYREAYGISDALPVLPGGLDADRYRRLLGEAIVGSCDPENVILLEVDPARQKTRHDFMMTERWFGVRAVDIRCVRQEGRRLFYQRDGRWTPVERIYNRAIVDELERKGIALPFEFHDDLEVEWAGHPNWFFLLSKFSLPYLKHRAVPRTVLLSEAGEVDDPQRYVLKPLYSFAGSGVVVGPSREQLDAVPDGQRRDYILQERVDFRPVVDTPHGPTKIEVRVMYLWLDEMITLNTIIRMGRGAQMGVDHNKGFEWVGASAAFLDPTE